MENMYNETTAMVTPAEIAEAKTAGMMVRVEDLQNPGESMMYCSLISDGSMASKAAIYNAVNSPDRKIADMIGETIALSNIVAHTIMVTDEKTGEALELMRTVLVDADGVAYEAVSTGIANAIARILQIFGQPSTWSEPIKVKIVQKGTRNGTNKVTTLKIEA